MGQERSTPTSSVGAAVKLATPNINARIHGKPNSLEKEMGKQSGGKVEESKGMCSQRLDWVGLGKTETREENRAETRDKERVGKDKDGADREKECTHWRGMRIAHF